MQDHAGIPRSVLLTEHSAQKLTSLLSDFYGWNTFDCTLTQDFSKNPNMFTVKKFDM